MEERDGGRIGAEELERLLNQQRWNRRRFLQMAGAGAAALGFSGALAACRGDGDGGGDGGGGGGGGTPSAEPVRIGYVSPATGVLSPFGEADDFILGGVRETFADGLQIAGQTRSIEIITKDSQSDPNRAATVASELITDEQIDLMVVASTPETTNPVSGQCEANGVPCISTVAPWQPWFLGQQQDPANPVPFTYAYHFFWGLEDIEQVFFDMWETISTNKTVGGLFPNDGDGNAWGDPQLGFPSFFEPKGYRIVDPGRYENGTQDFTAQISRYRDAGAEILTGVPIPPDFTNFWTQANQQGFVPKIASVGKALLFPASVEALGDIGEGMSTEVWWTPSHPFSSSLTGASAADLGAAYTESTSRQWTQPIGFVHALFEVAADVLLRTAEVSPDAIVESIKATNLETIVGPIQWTGEPFPNVAKTKLAGGQWKVGTDFPFDLVVVSNGALTDVPIGGDLEPIGR
jgi:branched-chain amino acid transport system substrate-binding protein